MKYGLPIMALAVIGGASMEIVSNEIETLMPMWLALALSWLFGAAFAVGAFLEN